MSSKLPEEAFSISADFGGRDVSDVVLPLFFALKKALRTAGPRAPCDRIGQFAFILRADGEVSQFNFEGCENIELNLRKKYISIDVGVPIARWRGRTEAEIGAYLISCMRDGLNLMLSHLREKGIVCDDEKIRALFEEGARLFVAPQSNGGGSDRDEER